MNKRLMMILSCLFLSIGLISAQKKVSGNVVDDIGEPIVSASVVVKGTTVGVATDFDGNFTITLPEGKNILSFHLVGMKPLEMEAKDGMRIVLEEDLAMLEEVIVTGYGVSKKSAFTGAAGAIDASRISSGTDANPIKSLEGSVAGVQLSLGSGQPGAPVEIFIRGQNSINSGTQPLYVIDGVPVNADAMGMRKTEGVEISPLSTINSSDIESITVLKDATATSIYGARAANGVIVITTKRGVAGRTTVSFTARLGFESLSSMPSRHKTLNAAKYLELTTEAMMNEYNAYGDDSYVAYFNTSDDGVNAPYTPEGMKQILLSNNVLGVSPDMVSDVDWLDEITRKGFVQEYNVDVSGGGTSATAPRYFLSLGYMGNEAFIKGKDLTRYSIRLNLDQSPSSVIKFGLNTNLTFTDMNLGTGGGYFNDPFTQAYMQSPLPPVKDEFGDWNMNTLSGYNPVAQYSKGGDINSAKQYRALISPYVQVHLPQDLVFQSKAGLDFYFIDEFAYWSFLQPQGAGMRGMGENTNSRREYLTWTNTLNYSKTFKETHNLNLLFGQEIQKTNYKQAYLSASNFAVDYLTETDLASIPSEAKTSKDEAALASFFFNGEYDFDNKYYLSGSFRYDGSSRFGSSHRWAPFWAIGAKYRLTGEKAIADATGEWLDNLTLRASYGTTGNQEVGSQTGEDLISNPLYASRPLYGFGITYNGLPGSRYIQFGNSDLKWEETNKFNVGLDFSFLKKFTLEVDYYNHSTTDMVFDVPVSLMTGLENISRNIGELSNRGIEVTLGANLIRTKGWNWNVTLTAAHNKNEVKKLSTDKPIELTYKITEAGKPLNTFKMIEWAGVDPETGSPMWYKGTTGNETTTNYSEAGKRYVGDANPDLTGSFTNSLKWKGVDFSFQLNYSIGGKIYGNNLRYDEHVGGALAQNFTEYVYDNRWQKPGDVTDVPSLLFGDDRRSNNHSSRFLMDADYLKIKSITLGYTLPTAWVNAAKISNARVFMNADNLYTFTKSNFRGFDPSGVKSDGVQWWNYPLPRTVLFGLTLGF